MTVSESIVRLLFSVAIVTTRSTIFTTQASVEQQRATAAARSMREKPDLYLMMRFIVVGHTTNVILFSFLVCVCARVSDGKRNEQRMSTTTSQVGCIAEPLEVQWGPSHWDKGQTARSIKVFLDYSDQKTEIDALDETLVKFDTPDGRAVLRLKVWQNAKVSQHDSDKKFKVDDLQRGDQIVVVAKPYHWQHEGTEGVSLNVSDILIVKRVVTSCAGPTWS